MCGICGYVSFSGRTIDRTILKKMVSVQRHRGPDDLGYWYSDNVALGHSRLSIVDIQRGGQPMVDPCGLVIVFNGEIYNYREIRKVLIGKGEIFLTKSDTEVILKSYKIWGERCVDHLNGMFSFAIVDRKNKKLFLARDHFGKKPLHYLQQDDLFIFASEIKAILQDQVVRSRVDIDERSLLDYLSVGYVLSPKTIYKQICRLPEASWAYVDLITGKISVTRYWNFGAYYKLPKLDNAGHESTEKFESIFFQSVKTRLQADVPVGAFLSSGLDSTSVVEAATTAGTERLRAFNIGFREESYDESVAATDIASILGTNLETRYFEPVSKSEISRLVWHFDEPFSDNSAQPTFQLNKLASKYTKVALSGDGADELFAGYPTYRADKYFQLYRKLPYAVQKVLQASATKLLPPTYRKVSFDYKVRQFLGSSGLSPEAAHYWWRVIFPLSETEKILSAGMLESLNGYTPFQNFQEHFKVVKDLPLLDQALYVDAKTWLLDDILVKVDRMSMAHSVEVRSPFLDRNLAEFAAQLPTNLKMNAWNNKVIIRKSMSRKRPILTRNSRKRGFNSPPIDNIEYSLPRDPRFQGDYGLKKMEEDTTFKENNLVVLNIWFDMFTEYKRTGKWEAIVYDK